MIEPPKLPIGETMKKILTFVIACLILASFSGTAWGDLYTASKACARVSCSRGVGSGIIVGSDGQFYYLLTNAHVATEPTAKIEFFDAGRVTIASGTVIQRDAEIDLAVLKVDTKGYNPAIVPIDPAFTMSAGDVLCTIGHPNGQKPTLFFCTYLETDPVFGVMFTPPPAQGRSGSPLLSKDGERIVGIVYGYTTADLKGLAIPAEHVADFVKGAAEGKRRKTKWVPPKDNRVVRFTEKRSILVDPEEPENDEEEAEPVDALKDPETVEETAAPAEFIPVFEFEETAGRNWPIFQPIIPEIPQLPPWEPIRPFRQFREKRQQRLREILVIPYGDPQQQQRPDESSELTGLKIQIGDVQIETGKEPEKGKKQPPEVVPTPPPRKAQPLPPIPPEFYIPQPPPAKPYFPPPGPHGPKPGKPAPRHTPPPRVAEQAAAGAVVLTQYSYPFQYEPNGSCPNGNCPIVREQKPADIVSPQPIPIQILPKEGSPQAETPAPAPQKTPEPKPEPAPQTAPAPKPAQGPQGPPPPETKPAPALARLEALEQKLREAEERLAKIETTETLFGRKPLGEAVQDGLGSAGQKLGEAVTLEIGGDVKAALNQGVETMKAGSETLEGAKTAFEGAMNEAVQTLQVVQQSINKITRAIYVIGAGLAIVAYLAFFVSLRKKIKA